MENSMSELINKARGWLAGITGVRKVPDILSHPGDPGTVTLKLPAYCQTQSHTCGFTAGLMILHHFRPKASADRFYACVSPDPATGTSNRRLIRALLTHGISVAISNDLDFEAIASAIDNGKPLAVTVRTRDKATHHWTVVYGYGRDPKRIYLAGNGFPLLYEQEYTWKRFRMGLWVPAGFGLVCGRRGRRRQHKA
jgi:hypothetical protein